MSTTMNPGLRAMELAANRLINSIDWSPQLKQIESTLANLEPGREFGTWDLLDACNLTQHTRGNPFAAMEICANVNSLVYLANSSDIELLCNDEFIKKWRKRAVRKTRKRTCDIETVDGLLSGPCG